MPLLTIKTEKIASFILISTTIVLFFSLWKFPSSKTALLIVFFAFFSLLIALYPKFGPYMLVFSIPLLQPISITAQYNVNLLDIFLPIIIISFCFRAILLHQNMTIKGKKIIIPFSIYVFVCGLSLIKAFFILGSISYIMQMLLNYIRLIESFFLFVIIVNTIKPRQTLRVLNIFLFLSALFGLAAIYKYYFIVNFSVSTSQRLGLILVKPMEVLSNEGPNEAAAVFLICFGVTLNLIFSTKNKRIYYLYIAIFLYCILLSNSRSALVGFIILALYFIITERKNPKIWLFLFTLPIILFILSEGFITKIMDTINYNQPSFYAETALGRIQAMLQSIALWTENIGNLLLGIGYAGLRSSYMPWGSIVTSENFYIEVLTTSGLLGLVTFFYFLWVIFKKFRFSNNGVINGFRFGTIGLLILMIGASSLYSLHVMNYFVVFLAFAFLSNKTK